jgi:hypothetical protein
VGAVDAVAVCADNDALRDRTVSQIIMVHGQETPDRNVVLQERVFVLDELRLKVAVHDVQLRTSLCASDD